MTDIAFLIVAILAGIHSGSYALYEHKQGNRFGAGGVILLALASTGVFLYRIFTG
ncbi:hypothetical protein [Sporomusa termitida]|uniref:Uncharacterized protein n=1 Tax=Sporomusa termitida TaxID=2377 RepID=A0A517DVY0_9FIRM|nr:hypothetical protein [Sporomusa termitida]QDR81512.1 hypothetical protein SPTER_28980 [Sporomusa termitida]